MAKRPPPIGPKALVVSKSARADIDGQLAHFAETAGIEVALKFADKIDGTLFQLAKVGHAGVNRDSVSSDLRMTVLAFTASTSAPPALRFGSCAFYGGAGCGPSLV